MLNIDMKNILFTKPRDLLSEEYKSVHSKQNMIDVDLFRKVIFSPTSRGLKYEYKEPKIIWEGENKKVSISHFLHQKHADILSLIHTDYIEMEKPNKDGSYRIFISLYRLAKLMGYKYPEKATSKVRQFINDIRWTDFIVDTEDIELRTTILSDAYFDRRKEVFIIEVGSKSAKIITYATAIKMEKSLTHQIVNISSNLPRIKALVRYMLSSKPTKYGLTMEHLFKRLEVIKENTSKKNNSAYKSKFKKELLDNQKFLENFNLIYNEEEEKIYYTQQHKEVTFELALNKEKMVQKLISPKDTKINQPFKELIGKKFKLNDIWYEVISFSNINKENNIADIELLNTSVGRVGTAKGSSLDNLRGYIEGFEG